MTKNNDIMVADVISGLDDIAVVTICENNVGHAYFDGVDPEFLNRHVLYCFVVKRSYGFEVYIEV